MINLPVTNIILVMFVTRSGVPVTKPVTDINLQRHELAAFLKARGVPTTGLKGSLLSLAKLYANRPEVISDPEVTFKSDTRSIFYKRHWKILTSFVS